MNANTSGGQRHVRSAREEPLTSAAGPRLKNDVGRARFGGTCGRKRGGLRHAGRVREVVPARGAAGAQPAAPAVTSWGTPWRPRAALRRLEDRSRAKSWSFPLNESERLASKCLQLRLVCVQGLPPALCATSHAAGARKERKLATMAVSPRVSLGCRNSPNTCPSRNASVSDSLPPPHPAHPCAGRFWKSPFVPQQRGSLPRFAFARVAAGPRAAPRRSPAGLPASGAVAGAQGRAPGSGPAAAITGLHGGPLGQRRAEVINKITPETSPDRVAH